ncbi:MAG: DUF924 family protein [Cyanobacteriota bacterium]|jgi:uncharacterized protein (DUF924 family)
MDGERKHASEVLRFWFPRTRPRQCFAKDPAFDALPPERVQGLTRRAIAAELNAWRADPAGGLALVLLLDQFPRQIWRDTAMAFAGDSRALALSLKAVERGWLEAEPEQARRQFWLMPLMHSEDSTVQEAALPLFERFSDPRTADFARRYRDVIARFGRFPHRDALLGRMSSAEELAFSNKLLMQRVLYEKVHVAVDDATSLAYVEVPAVERKPT